MRRMLMISVCVLSITLCMAGVPLSLAGESQAVMMPPIEGRVKTITIDVCGLQPGYCTGSMVLAMVAGGDVCVAIRPGIQIERGGQLVTVDELGVGDFIIVQSD